VCLGLRGNAPRAGAAWPQDWVTPRLGPLRPFERATGFPVSARDTSRRRRSRALPQGDARRWPARRSYGGSNARKLFQTAPKEKGPAEAGPSTWGMRKEGFSSAAKQSGARETVRVISKENRTVSFQQQKMWRCYRKGPAMATAGPVRVLVCPPRFLPQSACLLSPASGDVRCHWTLRQRRRG
jgi:hypothetical protein